MANHATNRVTIAGDAGEIARLRAEIIRPTDDNDGELTFSLQAIVPMPERLNDPKERVETVLGPIPAWADWRLTHWGTKCETYDFREQDFEQGDDELVVTFSSAWSAPAAAYRVLAARFPRLTFEFLCIEEGNGEAYRANAEGGALDECFATDRDDPEAYASIHTDIYGCPPEFQGDEADEGSGL